MHEIDPARFLSRFGIIATESITPVAGGWGGTTLWRVRRSGTPSDLLLRRFPGGPPLLADREAAAQRLARDAGVPVPDVIAHGATGEDAAIVTTWAPGTLLARYLEADPGAADAIGRACGAVLADLHAVAVDPAAIHRDADDWLRWAGDETARLRPLLAHASPRDRLLHLDFHPENILVADGIVRGVIDWANVRIGPPPADLARTWSILELIKRHPDVPTVFHPVIDTFGSGLLAEYGRHRPMPSAAEFRVFQAWALAAQLTDLAPMLAAPATWLTREIFDDIRARYDAIVATLDDER